MSLSILRIKKVLTNYLEKKFPKRNNIEVLELTSLAKGWETELFSFVFKYQEEKENKEDLILRIYPGKNSQNKTEKEYRVLETLYKAGYPVPEVYILELDSQYLDNSFIIMERILGEDIGEDFIDLVQKGDYERLNEEILTPMTNLFVKLHNLDWRSFQTNTEMEAKQKQENYISWKLNVLESRLEENQLSELLPILEWLKRNNTKIDVSLAIIHGDFHPHNIMVSNQGEYYVIDWPACSVGDYREDLGWTLMLTGAYTSKQVRDMALESYEIAKGIKVQHIEYFEILSTIRRLEDILLLFKKGAESAGMREEAIQQIKDSLPHLEYVISLIKEITGIAIPEVENFIQSILRS